MFGRHGNPPLRSFRQRTFKQLINLVNRFTRANRTLSPELRQLTDQRAGIHFPVNPVIYFAIAEQVQQQSIPHLLNRLHLLNRQLFRRSPYYHSRSSAWQRLRSERRIWGGLIRIFTQDYPALRISFEFRYCTIFWNAKLCCLHCKGVCWGGSSVDAELCRLDIIYWLIFCLYPLVNCMLWSEYSCRSCSAGCELQKEGVHAVINESFPRICIHES